MITLNWQGMQGEIGQLIAAFDALPRHIAKKHLLATIRRVGKQGVPVLKSNTPVGKTQRIKSTIRRGQQVENAQRRGGALRRASTVVARYKGKNKDGFAYGVLGYKFGWESRKAIWLEEGTTRIAPRRMVGRTMQAWQGPARAELEKGLAQALAAAVREVASGRNPGMSARGLAAGVAPR